MLNLSKAPWKTLLGVGGMMIVGGVLYESRGPDLLLTSSRVLPTEYDFSHFSRRVSSLTRWPLWFRHLQFARLLNGTSPEDTLIFEGSHIELHLKPPKKKAFQLQVRVTQYDPLQGLRLQLESDSTQKLTQAFQFLEWQLEWGESGTLKGRTDAQTGHWRARLWGRLAPRTLLFQSFFPQLLTLATVETPFVLAEGASPPFSL